MNSENQKVEELKSALFFGRRARVDQRAIRGKMEFFSELDWVQLFSPNIDLLGSSSSRSAEPPERIRDCGRIRISRSSVRMSGGDGAGRNPRKKREKIFLL